MAFIPVYIFVLGTMILIDYLAGYYIEKCHGFKKRIILIISILSTCLVLFVFKYFNFFNTNLAILADWVHWNYPIKALNLILPLGLSFHTFQSLSYVIEVYRGNQKAERNFGVYALYVMFFPQLVAGPIERPQHLLHQFYEKHDFDYEQVTDGLKLMAWGMFKKVVIADRLAVFVNTVYDKPAEYQGISLIVATVFFAFQIYCDFSGYTDIAIGAAQVMGFKLMDNFNRPYSSRSIVEFWKRWHISLSTWFRDYLYIPLGGNRVTVPRWYLNLMITFLVSGVWHGAHWTYIVWGALHGSYMVIGRYTEEIRKKITSVIFSDRTSKIYHFLQVLSTFSLVTFAWIFFRAKSIHDAVYIATHLFSGLNFGTGKFAPILPGQPIKEFFIAIVLIIFLEWIHSIQNHGSIRHMLAKEPVIFRWIIYFVFVYGGIYFAASKQTQFIYFQF
jgi:D-alanyl-lipoteichoic acid acyltransferase DltB (MBOAT superfamily)